MNRSKRSVMWAALTAIILLVGFSVYGAFLGADRAQAFFNSLPLALYWGGLAVLLIVGIVLFRRLVKVPSLLLVHLGCILLLAGGMWGSKAGHTLQKRLLGADVIRKGQMPILEGTTENRVQLADSNDTGELPFSIRLADFRIEYYKPGTLILQDRAGGRWRMPAKPGETLALGAGWGKVTVQKTFENWKMDISGDQRVAFDAPGGNNPAVEVAHEKPDGSTTQRFVFPQQMGHMNANQPLHMSYHRSISDYISELKIIEDGREVAGKDIEVNHPLHYGGYHFYQHSYGQNEFGEYTVLMVVSDAGLNVVYAGYAMLIAGVFWHFLGRRLLKAARSRAPHPSENSAAPTDRTS